MIKIFKKLRKLNIKTIYFNFKLFPFKQAIYLPLIIHRNCIVNISRGGIIFHCKIRPGLLKIGFNGVGTTHPFRDKTIIRIDKGGELHVYNFVNIGCGSNIAVAKNAKLIFLGNNDITARSTFITHKKIQIGVNTVISWDCLFMDTDFHNVLHHSEIMNPDREITIGNNCWIGCRCTILKGFILPDNCVLGANSVGTKNLDCENSLYAGNPAVLRKNNITWNG